MRFRTELLAEEIALGFTPETDLFKKGDLALRITGLFEKLEHGSVCLLDGRWGTGKTTFVKQWAAELEARNIPSIYFDAFESDYIETPFQAIAGTFVAAAMKARRESQPAFRRFLSRAASVGRAVGAVSAKVGLKAATLGAIELTDLEMAADTAKTICDDAGSVAEEAVKLLLKEHANVERQFVELRSSLTDLPRLLQPSPSEQESVPLIVFVDELDRCRPDFALGILEVLKHFFRADGIHFVLVTNRDHLKLSVNHRYGSGAASAEYLEKFYDFVVYFDNEYGQHEVGGVNTFVSRVTSRLLSGGDSDIRELRENIRNISIAFRLTLRQIEAYATNVAIAYLAAREREFRPNILVSVLAIIKTLRPDLYRRAREGSLDWLSVDEFLSAASWASDEGTRLSKVFQYYLDDSINLNDPEWRGWGEADWRYNITRERVIPYLAKSVLDRFAVPSERERRNVRKQAEEVSD